MTQINPNGTDTQTDHLISVRKRNQQQKKKTCKFLDFAVLSDPRLKLKESEKGDKYLKLARDLYTSIEHEGDDCTNIDWCFWYITKELLKELEDLELSARV